MNTIIYEMTEPEFKLLMGGLKITFFASNQKESLESDSEKGSEKTSVKILTLLQHNNTLTIAELSRKIGLSTCAIEKNLKKLQKTGQLKRVGSDRKRWECQNIFLKNSNVFYLD